MANVYKPSFDDESDREGFAYRDAWIADQAGSDRLGASLYEIEPGQTTFPYHWHSGNEEMLIVIAGSVALRTPQGTREVEQGAVVAFPRGERGAHQVLNHGERTARFLVVSERHWPEVCFYPDSNKVGVRSADPESADSRRLQFVVDDAVDYWQGEKPPS